MYWILTNLYLPSIPMKRFISLFILITYSLTTFGVGLQFHYCGKKISSVQVVFKDEHTCKCGKGKMKPGCCKDEIKYFKVKSDHSKSSSTSSFKFQGSLFLPKIFSIQSFTPFSDCVRFSLDKPPPDIGQVPIYKRNSIFLI